MNAHYDHLGLKDCVREPEVLQNDGGVTNEQ